MGRRGPKAAPAAVKAAKGNPGRRPLGEDPPAGAVVAPKAAAKRAAREQVTAPSGLKGEALKIWKRLAPRLVAMKLLSPVDASTFARYCRNYARWVEINDWLDKNRAETSVHYLTETGFERIRAAMMVSLRLEPVLERIEDRFGLNPSERQRIFAQRAAVGAPNDLFDQAPPDGAPHNRPEEQPFRQGESPVGLLN